MSDSIHIGISGDRQAGIRFEAFPDVLYEELRQEIDGMSRELFMRVQASTPQNSGRLRSQERLRLFTDNNRITGYVDIGGQGSQDFRKAAALEYGSTGKKTPVKSHAMLLDHFWSKKLELPITVVTKAFARAPNIAEHRFERGSLAAMQPEIVARLKAVVARAVAKANEE